MRRPEKLIYGVNDKVPFFTTVIMTIQHSLILVVALLLPALIISVTLGPAPNVINAVTAVTTLAMALGCLVLVYRSNWFGCGYLCPASYETSYMIVSILALSVGGIPLLLGMSIYSGVAGMIFALLLPSMKKLIPPEVVGVCLLMIGVGLLDPILKSSLDITGVSGHHHFNPTDAFVFLVTFTLMIIISVWGKALMSRYSLVIGYILGSMTSYFCGLYDANTFNTLQQKPFFDIPHFPYLGHYAFSPELIIPFTVAAFSSAMKTMGNVAVAQQINDRDWIKPDLKNIKSALLTQGLLTVISSLFGGLAIGTSTGNVGITESTRITSRYVNIGIGLFFGLLVFLPKILAFLTLTPAPVRGAIIMYAICFIIVSGLKMITERGFNARRIVVVGASFLMGLTVHFVPEFNQMFPGSLRFIMSSSLSVATLTAFLLTLLFRLGITQKETYSLNIKESFEPALYNHLSTLKEQWSVFPHLMHNAEQALLYCLEAIHLLAEDSLVTLTISYDEYHLTFTINYTGKALAPSNIIMLNDGKSEADILPIAIILFKKYASDISIQDNNHDRKISFKVID